MHLRLRHLIALTFVFIAFFSLQPLAAHSEPVVFITEETPPIAYTQDGTLQGYNIDLIKYIWKKMNMPEQEIKVQPWARSVEKFNTKTPTCLFPVALTKQRKDTYRYVATPFSFKVVLLTLKKNAHQFKTLSQIKNARICVTKASSILSTLREQGYSDKNFEFGRSFASTVKKFQKERAPLLVGSVASVALNYRLIGGDPSDLQIVALVKTVPNAFLFNNAVPQEFIDKFKKVMDDFTKSEETKAIYDKAVYYYHPQM